MFEAWEPRAADLRVIGRTRASPGQMFVTARDHDPAPIRAALIDSIKTLAPHHAATLGLRGIVQLSDAAFDMPLPDAPKGALQSA
ncbi:hypothetical protein N8Z63_08895 [Octadecabacter sp.]|nr:hypothetical protein [Octadecabacter sp.]